jgi:tetratricopeptide (TPR) repeat protein
MCIRDSNPTNKDLRFFYGFSLLMKAGETGNKSEARQLQIQARKELEKARELGMRNKDLDKIISSLPSDGNSNTTTTITSNTNTNRSSATYSSNREAQEFMQKGEEFFAKREYQKAFEMYEKALRKDPNLYEAALFSGDVFLQIGRGFQENDSKRKENFDKAETWYQKAMIINPNRETAYRYSATPLMLTKQFEKARDRYIEAYITEPYNERALGGLRQWAEVTKIEIGHPAIIIPADVVSISNDTEDGSFAWSTYFSTLASWQTSRDGLSEKFKNAYPNEKSYRRSLGERFDALKATVLALKEKMSKSDNSVKKLEPSLATLVKLYDEGLLESYILLAIRDEDVAKDQPNYLKENREKMRRYVAKYVVGND